jgi:hypothetical protein
MYAMYLQTGIVDDVTTDVQFMYNGNSVSINTNVTNNTTNVNNSTTHGTNSSNITNGVTTYSVSITLPHFWEYSGLFPTPSPFFFFLFFSFFSSFLFFLSFSFFGCLFLFSFLFLLFY